MTDEEAFQLWYSSPLYTEVGYDQEKQLCRDAFMAGLRLASIRVNSHKWADETWRRIHRSAYGGKPEQQAEGDQEKVDL